jgi:hypothetical protein
MDTDVHARPYLQPVEQLLSDSLQPQLDLIQARVILALEAQDGQLVVNVKELLAPALRWIMFWHGAFQTQIETAKAALGINSIQTA